MSCCHYMLLFSSMSPYYVSIIVFIATLSLLFRIDGEPTRFEFGGALKQELALTRKTDSDVISVVKFAVQYAEKRCPWGLPARYGGKVRKQPHVANLTKVNLVFSSDDIIPLYYDSAVTDKNGQRHGITSLIIFGSMYRFQLHWRDKSFHFFHNFTVSVVQFDTKYIYSHTYLIVSENATESANLNKEYLKKNLKGHILLQLPINSVSEGSNYIDWTDISQSVPFDFDFSHMTESNSQSKPVDCDIYDDCDERYRNGEFKYFQYKNKKFSIMSYNIWNMNPKTKEEVNYVQRMELLKQVIDDTNPDILGLQEVRYEEIQGGELGPSQIHTISEWFPEYQYVFQPGQMQPNSIYEGRTEEGVAILSKFPIVSHGHKFLFRNMSNSADRHQRVLLHTEILIPLLGKLHILNTHLSLSHEAREESVIEIWQYIKELQGPVIFMGDLNAEPEERAIQYLNGKDVLDAEPPHLKDVWLETHGFESKGYTFNPREELNKRIDYMYLRPSETCCQIDSCDVIDNGKRGKRVASDHLPIQAVFSFQVRRESS